VPNSAAGQVCAQLGLKGPGTVLIGGNVFVYSKLLLDTGRADLLFVGAVEEYSRDLWDSLKKNEYSTGLVINEAAVVMTLEPAGDKPAYCALGNGASAALQGFPAIKKIDPDLSMRAMSRALSQCIEKNRDAGDVDVVFSAAAGSYFDEVEARALAEALPRSIIVPGVKEFFGETLGCAFCLNAATAAMCIKNKAIPPVIAMGVPYDADFRNILVTGFDPAGNYSCLVLKRCE
jgi:hypothetical protein